MSDTVLSQLTERGVAAIAEAAIDVGVEHGHVLVMVFSRDVPADEPVGAFHGAGFSGDVQADGVDPQDPNSIANALSEHLQNVVKMIGATNVGIAKMPFPPSGKGNNRN